MLNKRFTARRLRSHHQPSLLRRASPDLTSKNVCTTLSTWDYPPPALATTRKWPRMAQNGPNITKKSSGDACSCASPSCPAPRDPADLPCHFHDRWCPCSRHERWYEDNPRQTSRRGVRESPLSFSLLVARAEECMSDSCVCQREERKPPRMARGLANTIPSCPKLDGILGESPAGCGDFPAGCCDQGFHLNV